MSDLVWNDAPAFWLLWLLPVLVATAIWSHHRVKRAAQQFAGTVMTPRLLPPLSGRGPFTRTALLTGGLLLCIVAAAGPAWGVFYRPAVARGLDLVVALDVSRSMLADDAGDTRLGRAKSAINWLADELAGDRVGLLLFAGQNVQTCPLTLDRGFFHAALNAAGPALVGRGGTKIGPALDEALRMLDTSWDRDKLVLLVTDGGDQESFPKAAADRLREKKVRVITLGLGRADPGAPLILEGKVVRQKDGQPVSARLNDTLLKDLAVATQGMYVPPEAAHRLPELYAEHFGSARRGQNQEVQEKLHREQFQWFLVAGFLLLLCQAGASNYPRRRGTAGTGALAALALCAVVLCTSCSRTGSAIDAALAQLAAGDAEAAEKAFTALHAEHPDEPVIAYDLGCAHEARNRPSEARARYVEALDRGDRALRARVHVNLAMLAVDRLAASAGSDPTAKSGEARDDLRKLAEGALDDLQVARDLDPKLQDVARRQDLLARWLRVIEDAWRSRDRDAERAERDKLKGAAWLGAIASAEEGLLSHLQGEEVLEDVELRQRDLAEELGKAKDHFADQGSELAESFRDEVGKGIDEIAVALQSIAAQLRDAQVDEAGRAIRAAAERLRALWVLWADPGEALQSAAQQQSGFVEELIGLSSMRQGAAGADAEQLAVAARAQEELTDRAKRLQATVVNLGRRVAVEPVDPAWSPLCVERAKARLPEIAEQIGTASTKIASTGPQAVVLSTRARQALQSLALEWQISGLAPTALAERLEQAEIGILRGTDALLVHAPLADGLVQRLGRMLEDFQRSLAWAPLRSEQIDQLARAEYLEPALEKALAHKPDGSAPPDQKAEAERRERLHSLIAAVRDALVRAKDALGSAPSTQATDAMQQARMTLRTLALAESDFESVLRRAAHEQSTLAAASEGAAATEAKDDALAGLALAHRVACREQGVTGELVAVLATSLAAETARLDAPAASSEDPKAKPSAADEEERKARHAAMQALGALLTPADEAIRKASTELGSDEAEGTDAQKRLAAAAPEQRRAADLLERALKQLEDARLPLTELATRVADAEARLLTIARELKAGRESKGKNDQPLSWQDLHAAQAEVGGYVARMPAALQRELDQAKAQREQQQQQQGGATPAPAVPETESEEEKELHSMVEAVVGTHAASMDALDGKDAARDVAAVENALAAGRELWAKLGDFQKLLKSAVDEEADLMARSRAFAQQSPAADRPPSASADQSRTGALIPPLLDKLAVLEQQAAQTEAAPKQGGADPSQGQSPPANTGVSKETIELARKNLPAARTAIDQAVHHLDSAAFNDAGDRQEEAHRLLKEILDKLQQDQQKQQQDQQQQQQQQQQAQQQPQQAMSKDELARLLQAVRERNKRENKPSPHTAVQEDW
ncbi:MAG: VWA domain-containing protein [Planctomycetota bacterium]